MENKIDKIVFAYQTLEKEIPMYINAIESIVMPSNSWQYIVEDNNLSGSDTLKDSFGNTVTDFVFDKGFYKKQ